MPDGYAAYVGVGLTLRRQSLRANADQRANILGEITALEPHYDSLNLPIELVHGTADDTVSIVIHSDKLVERIDSANLTTLEGIGHMPHHVSEDAVVDAIDRAVTRAGLR